MEDIKEWLSLINNGAFPIVVVGYLFLRFEKKIETLNTNVLELLREMKEEIRKK